MTAQQPDPQHVSQHFADKDKARAEAAFAEYVTMGPQRSIQKLLDRFQARRRVDGSDANVPTTNRNRVYWWAKEYDWYARVEALDQEHNEASQRDYAAIRRVRLDELVNLSAKAVEKLEALLDANDESIQFRAIEAILNRTGLTQNTPHNPKTSKEPSDEQKAAMESPPADADVTQLQDWLRKRRTNQG